MSRPIPRSVPTLLVPLSLVLVTGCSTPDGRAPTLYDNLSVFGERSAEIGAHAWRETTRRLGLGRRDAVLDEVDLAMMEEDAVLPPSLTRTAAVRTDRDSVAPVAVVAAPRPESIRVVRTLSPAPSERSTDADASMAVADVLGDTVAAADAVQPDTAPESEVSAADAGPREYVVQPGESLWSIARTEAGDATHWKRLADANDLPPDAVVYTGETLIIPLDIDARRPASATERDAVTASTDATAPVKATASTERNGASESTVAARGIEVSDDEPAVGAANADNPAVPFTLNAGESLWELAKRATGDATNWQRIAEHNDINPDDVGLLHSGRVLLVPQSLTDGDAAEGDAASIEAVAATPKVPASDPLLPDTADSTSNATSNAPPAVANEANEASVTPTAAAVSASTTSPARTVADRSADESADETIAEPAVGAATSRAVARAATALDDARREPRAEPARIVEAGYRDEAARQDRVRVRGTYYPKAVYRQADFSSELLMRVSPGTAIRVSRAMGPWYEVVTDKGTGYMHSRDIR